MFEELQRLLLGNRTAPRTVVLSKPAKKEPSPKSEAVDLDEAFRRHIQSSLKGETK